MSSEDSKAMVASTKHVGEDTPLLDSTSPKMVAQVAAHGLVGRTLGEFMLMEKLGSGGFAAVYRAQQRTLGREVAVKVLEPLPSRSGDMVQRFLREARLASTLDHPYAAHVYAFGAELDGLLWIAMELVRGTTLADWLKTRGPLPLNEFIPFFDKLCEVVHTAHQQGIIHRDLKPLNIMVVNRAGRLMPKLLDLGVAKLRGDVATLRELPDSTPPDADVSDMASLSMVTAVSMELTTEKTAVGSPHYMAPEQWQGAEVSDGRSDIYALGILAYEALTGTRPFKGKTAPALLLAHTHAPIPALGEGFPAALSAAVARAAAKLPEDRFASALEFSEALHAAAELPDSPAELPRLAEDVRDVFLMEAPQPLAEAVALLDAARRPIRGLAALHALAQTLARWIAALALAARGRVGAGGDAESAAFARLCQRLAGEGLDELGWLELARTCCRPLASIRDAHPLPELLEFLFLPGGATDRPQPELERLLDLPIPSETAEPALLATEFAARLVDATRLLRAVRFLTEYPLLVATPTGAERWVGVRRVERAPEVLASPLPNGQVFLSTARAVPILTLSPLVQCAAPSPGSPTELFILDGHGRRGARLVSWPQRFERSDVELWEWFNAHVAPVSGGGSGVDDAGQRPYQGLSTFTAEQAQSFFGREKEAEAFANRLRAQSLLAVVGPSGAGKSSFVQAGVVPLLTGQCLVVTLRPGPFPLSTLGARLLQEAPDAGELLARLRTDAGVLGVLCRRLAQRSGMLLLVVDQFEELITLCADPWERAHYAESLVRAAQEGEGRVKIVLTLRDDFLIRVQALPALRERVSQGLQLLGTPAPDDLLRILLEPARRAGYAFEELALAQEMVGAVQDVSGALALLSFTAARLWELRDRERKVLSRKAYQALGGVGGALAKHAEETLAARPEEGQQLVREAFRHLVTAEGTRAILSRTQMLEVLGNSPLAARTLEELIQARLLVASEGAGDEDRIEVVHEALLGSWPRLVTWQREDSENARMRDSLRAAARQWQERGRNRGLLWRGDALLEYRLWRARAPGGITRHEAAFAEASLREEARGRRIRRGLLITALVVLSVGVVFLTRAYRDASLQFRRADAASREATARLAENHMEVGRTAVLSGDVLRGLVYLSQALSEGIDGPGMRYLLARATRAVEGARVVLAGHHGGVISLAVSPDDTFVVTGGLEGRALVWRLSDGQLLHTLEAGKRLWKVEVSPDSQRIVTADDAGLVRLWSKEGVLIADLPGHVHVYTVAFSPDGRLLASSGRDQNIRLWDARSGRPVAAMKTPVMHTTLAFSPDGRTLISAPGSANFFPPSDTTASVWNVPTARLRATLSGHTNYVRAVAVSPDGLYLATASADGTARLWRSNSGLLVRTFTGHRGVIQDVRFSPDSTRLITGSVDGTARVWKLTSSLPELTLNGHSGTVNVALFSARGDLVLTGGADGKACLWSADTGALRWVYSGHAGPILTAAFRVSGAEVVTGSYDQTARVWTTKLLLHRSIPQPPKQIGFALSADGATVLALSSGLLTQTDLKKGELTWKATVPGDPKYLGWSPDGRVVATDDENAVRLWSFPGLRPLGALKAHTAGIEFLTFSRDGRRLLTVSDDATAKLWDVPSRKLLLSVATGVTPTVAEVSPDGSLFAVGMLDGTVGLWNARTGAPGLRWRAHNNSLDAVSFSPDGTRLITASTDHGVGVWHTQTGEREVSLAAHAEAVMSAAFSPDGKLALSLSLDGEARIWDTETWLQVGALNGGSGSQFASFDVTGQSIVTGGSFQSTLDVWPADRATMTPEALKGFLRCHIPFALSGRRLVPSPLDPSACRD